MFRIRPDGLTVVLHFHRFSTIRIKMVLDDLREDVELDGFFGAILPGLKRIGCSPVCAIVLGVQARMEH